MGRNGIKDFRMLAGFLSAVPAGIFPIQPFGARFVT
jgi:hypothetical protein